jgi:integrase
VRRGRFATRAAAAATLEALVSPAGPEPGLSTGEWLARWLASRVSLRTSTSRSYAAHVRGYLVPYLGGIPLAALTAGDVQAMFTAIVRDESALGRPVSAATLHRIHATLRAALNGAVRAGLIAVNPGRFPELPRAARPRAQVWTPALTERWQHEGWRPVVGVWTAAQTAQFLRQVRGHRLYALFHLVALRGLRRGEAAGLRWSDLDLDAGTLTVTGQLQQLGGRMVAGPPKSDAGRRVIALDKTICVLILVDCLVMEAAPNVLICMGQQLAGISCNAGLEIVDLTVFPARSRRM